MEKYDRKLIKELNSKIEVALNLKPHERRPRLSGALASASACCHGREIGSNP
jgi:hypothetical protein